MENYLGLSGIVSHSNSITDRYNKLLNLLGPESMLIQFERFIDSDELKDLILFIESNLFENNIKL
jgi:hypothetical protein